MLQRRRSVSVNVSGVTVGGGAPIVVQSMTNTDTADAAATAAQVAALAAAGSELVRITVNTPEAAAAVPEIERRLEDMGVGVPLIGDFHYNGHILLTRYPRCAAALAKYRINPGNVGVGRRHDENFLQMIRVAMDSFAMRDVERAESLMELDNLIDGCNRALARRIIELGGDERQREAGLRAILISRCIERIGDNAVDIGEQTAFLVTGSFREFTDASHPNGWPNIDG